MSLDFLEPPGEDDAYGAHAKHWILDMPDGATVEGLADSLIREMEAIHSVEAGSIFIRRGEVDEDGVVFEVTAEEIRRRLAEAGPDIPEW
jgi:hypothetical protein